MGRPKKRYGTTAVNPGESHRDPTPTVNDPVARLDAKPMEHPRAEYERVSKCPQCGSILSRLSCSKIMPDREARIAYRKCKRCHHIYPEFERRVS